MKKLLAIIAVLGAVCCLFAGCSEEEPVVDATATPGAVSTPAATELPDIDIAHDETKFVMDGVILKAYIGDEENVEIPDGTIIIGDNAFRNCTTVKTITFKNSVTEIGDYAFYGCTSLTEIALPAMVTTVGDYAFAECTSLVSFESKTNTSDVGKAAFYNCSSLETAVVSKNISILAESMFEGCKSLKTVSFDNLKEIKNRAFYGCESLTGISANVLGIIHDEVFFGCTSFTDADKLSAVTEIGYDVFTGTKWLADASAAANTPEKQADSFVVIGKGVLVYYSGVVVEEEKSEEKAEDKAPAEDSAEETLVTLTLPGSVKVIGPGALSVVADEIEKIELPSTVIALCKGAFENFTNLQYIELSKSIVTIPESAFAGCEKLVTVVMPGDVEVIGASAFEGCVSLNSIVDKAPKKPEAEKKDEDATEAPATEAPATEAPEKEEPVIEYNVHNSEIVIDLSGGVKTIGDSAFSGCTSIKNIKSSTGKESANDKLESIGNYAFYNCSGLVIDDVAVAFGNALKSVGMSAFDGTPWYEESEEAFLIIGDGVLVKAPADYDFDLDKANKTEAEQAIKYVAVTLDENATEVSDKLFYDCEALVSVVIPEGVTTIGAYSFYHAENLKNIILPSTVTTIEPNAFYGCVNLESIIIPEGVKVIPDYAFYGCAKLSDIVLPEALEAIGKYAFYNCVALSEIVVPDSVKEVGAYAFDGTPWFELNYDKFMVVGDGVLLKYNGFADEVVFGAEDPEVKIAVGGAFEGVLRLKKITLPDSCKEIAEFAFSGATVVESVESAATVIAERAFNNCTNLKSVTYASGAEIAKDAFVGCPAYVG